MQGKKAFKFGMVEAKASLNWASLATSFAVAVLTWAGVELIPQLIEVRGESSTIGVIAGLVAQAIPMIVMYLRNNKDVEVDPAKKEQ